MNEKLAIDIISLFEYFIKGIGGTCWMIVLRSDTVIKSILSSMYPGNPFYF